MPISTADKPIVYWDACCFVSLIENDPQRMPVLSAIADGTMT